MSYQERRNYQPKKSNKVYVSNLNYLTTEQQLQALFAPFGTIVEVSLKRKESITFAFIEFETSEEAEAAISSLNRKSVAGLELKCEFAKGERKTFSGRGGYGDRGSFGDRGGYGGFGDRGGYRPRQFDGPPRRDFGDRPRGCFNCGQEGHMIRDCPKPKKPREYNNDRGDDRGSYRGRGDYNHGNDRPSGYRKPSRSNSRSRSNDKKQKQRRRRSSSSNSR